MHKPLLLSMLLTGIVHAQTTFFSDQYGMPAGSATRSGNTTFFNDSYGMPQGSATQSGNTTFFNDQYGMPKGSAIAPIPSLPTLPQPQFTYPNPIQPLQPFGR